MLTVVEYGPATGVITQQILARMQRGSRLLAIDTNDSFLQVLRENVRDDRLSIFHESAANIKQVLQRSWIKESDSVDYVISGIPFTFLPTDVAEKIVKDTYDILAPGGKFIVYQFLKPDTRRAKGIHQHLPKAFKTIHREVEFLNIPPLRIYEAIKESSD